MLCERSDDLEVVLIEHGSDGDEAGRTGPPPTRSPPPGARSSTTSARASASTASSSATRSTRSRCGAGEPRRSAPAGPRSPRSACSAAPSASRPAGTSRATGCGPDRDVADVRLRRDRPRRAIVLHDARDVDVADVGVGVDGVGGVRQAELDVADVGERLEAVRARSVRSTSTSPTSVLTRTSLDASAVPVTLPTSVLTLTATPAGTSTRKSVVQSSRKSLAAVALDRQHAVLDAALDLRLADEVLGRLLDRHLPTRARARRRRCRCRARSPRTGSDTRVVLVSVVENAWFAAYAMPPNATQREQRRADDQ